MPSHLKNPHNLRKKCVYYAEFVMYIYRHENWPHFIWDKTRVLTLLAQVKWAQGLLLGKMQNLGFEIKGKAQLQSLTEEILKSNQIEGQLLNVQQVRSSIARKLGMPAEDIPVSRDIKGTVDMMLDAAQYYNAPVNKKCLCAWHKHMFPSGKAVGMLSKRGAIGMITRSYASSVRSYGNGKSALSGA